MMLEVTSQNFDQEVIKADIPVIVDMYAPWCGPCRILKPIFEELSGEFIGKYKFVCINIDEERDLSVKYKVSSIPTILFIKNGNLIKKDVGGLSKESLKSKIKSYFE